MAAGLRFKLRISAISVATFGFMSIGGAMAGDIFTPVSPDAAKAAASAPQVAGTAFAKVDSAALVSGLKASKAGTAVTLNLAPGVSIPVVMDRQDPTPAGMSAFAAHTPGDASSSSTIVVNDGTLYAVIQAGNATYEVQHVAGGVHSIARIDQDRYPGDKVLDASRPNKLPVPDAAAMRSIAVTAASAGADELAHPTANTVVRVSIISTLKARTHHTNWTSTAQASLTDANTAYANSGVLITLQSAGFGNLNNYDETNKTFDKLLSDLTNSAGVKSWRDSQKADLISIFRDDTGAGNAYCGLAWYSTTPSSATKNNAYSIVNIGCAVGNHSFAHELGHNMGLKHDRYVESAFGKDQSHYNYGYSNPPYKVRTVMAYADYCNSKGVSCTRVGYFSNPFKKSNNGVLGKNVGTTDPAYNARRLNETRSAIAAYR